MGSGATPTVFLLPLPRVPMHGLGPEAGLRQADYETPLSFGSRNSRGRTLVCIHWEDHGLGPASSQAPGGLTIPFIHICLAESTFPARAGTHATEVGEGFQHSRISPQ